MTIPYISFEKRNFRYRGPTEALKFASLLEEIDENLNHFMQAYNDLNDDLGVFASGNLEPAFPSGYLHPSGHILPDASGYLSYCKTNLRVVEDKFRALMLDEHSNE